MITLALDASTYTGTVAVFDESVELAAGETAMRGRDAERLMPLILEVLSRARVPLARVAQVVCGAGPGSFTSLRIAAALAKGLAVGRDLPLLAVPSLGLIVAANATVDGKFLAAMDALRGQWYAQPFRRAAGTVEPLDDAGVMSPEQLRNAARAMRVEPAGPGMGPGWTPHARGALALPASVVDLASWEPDYGRNAEAQDRWERQSGRPLPR